MDKLITVKDMQERYSCSAPTARKYLRQMFHYESPLTAPEWALKEWERNRERMPSGVNPYRKIEINYLREKGKTIVPRRRANNEQKSRRCHRSSSVAD
jgi:hypothetical protein